MKRLLFLLLISTTSFAQTNISGGIYSNTTWKKVNSPFIVTGNIVVFDGVTLTIEPGVIIKFASGTGLELRGQLIAIGTTTDTITFTSNNSTPAQNDWNGITVIGTTNPLGVGDQVTMDYCKGSYAHIFINLDIAYHGPYIFKHCYFLNNYQVNYDGGMPGTFFENCRFESNYTALEWCQFDSRVSHCTFINNVNGVNGIKQVDTCLFTGNSGIALSPYGATTGCTVTNNNIGVSCYFNSANNVFIHNNVSNNAVGVELLTYFNGSINFSGNTICNNTSYNIKLLQSNNADLHLNCWCSTDSASIRSKIYDGYANISYGLVNFLPIMTGCGIVDLGTNDHLGENNLSPNAYPNPFSNQLIFKSSDQEPVRVVLCDVQGKQILQHTFTGSTTINTEQFADGIYFYELRNANGTLKIGKLVKQ